MPTGYYPQEPVFIQHYEAETGSGFKKGDAHRFFRAIHKLISIVQFTLMQNLGLNDQESNTYY